MGASSPLKGLSVNSMKFLAFLLFSSALALPRPAEEEMVAEEQDIAAVPYVHEEIEAEPYVHEDIAAEAYVHEDISAEAYVHEEIDALPYVHEEVAYNHEDIPAGVCACRGSPRACCCPCCLHWLPLCPPLRWLPIRRLPLCWHPHPHRCCSQA